MIDNQIFGTAIAVISLTMMFTPILAGAGARLARWLDGGQSASRETALAQVAAEHTHARAVIAGYGRVGHTVGTILGSSGIPYLAFDTDAALVDKWRGEGHPVYYGDICNPALFDSAALQAVDLVILTIDNGPEAVRAATLIRSHAPHIDIVARARDLMTCDALHQVGVRHAFPETLEASLRLAAESLEALGVSNDETGTLLRGVRSTDYELVRAGPEALAQPEVAPKPTSP